MLDTIIHWALIAYLIIAPTIAVFLLRKSALAFALVVTGATALLLTRPDIQSFGLLGLQATLERQIGRVQVTIEELQKLAAAMAKANLSQLAISGQLLHGLNTDVKFDMRDKIIASLKEIRVSDVDIHDAQELWIAIYCDFLVSQIEGEAQKLLPSAAAEINKLPEAPHYGVPEPETLESWLASYKVSSPRLDQLMDEYKRLWRTGSMKDPSIIPFNSAMRMKDR